MRYLASEKLEIIRLVEESHLLVTRTLGMLGIPRTTFYRRTPQNAWDVDCVKAYAPSSDGTRIRASTAVDTRPLARWRTLRTSMATAFAKSPERGS